MAISKQSSLLNREPTATSMPYGKPKDIGRVSFNATPERLPSLFCSNGRVFDDKFLDMVEKEGQKLGINEICNSKPPKHNKGKKSIDQSSNVNELPPISKQKKTLN